MRAKFIYESLVDVLKPKAHDEIIRDLSKLSQGDKNYRLIKASWNGHKDIAEMLLKAGADANARSRDGQTTLMGASTYGYKDIAEMLLKAGADVNARSKGGGTPLMRASWNGKKDVVALLKKYGAKIK